jgi:hypothetical protein
MEYSVSEAYFFRLRVKVRTSDRVVVLDGCLGAMDFLSMPSLWLMDGDQALLSLGSIFSEKIRVFKGKNLGGFLGVFNFFFF